MDVDRELEGIRTLDLEGGDERLVALLASDCVYHEDPHWLDGRVFRGRDEIAAIHSEYRELWGTRELRIEAAERVGFGDRRELPTAWGDAQGWSAVRAGMDVCVPGEGRPDRGDVGVLES